MEDPIPIKIKATFDRNAYARNYQKNRYANDPVFKENQLNHVKKLYQKNKELLSEYKKQLKLKEISNNNNNT